MKIKLLLDENTQVELAVELRKRKFDVYHVQEVGRKGYSDPNQLVYAVREKRCVVTFDIQDYTFLYGEYLKQGKDHFGIILSKERPIGENLKRLITILESRSQEDMKNQLIWL